MSQATNYALFSTSISEVQYLPVYNSPMYLREEETMRRQHSIKPPSNKASLFPLSRSRCRMQRCSHGQVHNRGALLVLVPQLLNGIGRKGTPP